MSTTSLTLSSSGDPESDSLMPGSYPAQGIRYEHESDAESDSSIPPARPLPEGKNIDDRPVWEPPVLGYDALIGEEYDKRREAALKYTGGDAAKTTEIMDASIEWDLFNEYDNWIQDNMNDARDRADTDVLRLFQELSTELYLDFLSGISPRYRELHIQEDRNDDGTWVIKSSVTDESRTQTPEAPLRPTEGGHDSDFGTSITGWWDRNAPSQPEASIDEPQEDVVPPLSESKQSDLAASKPLAMILMSLHTATTQIGNGNSESSTSSDVD